MKDKQNPQINSAAPSVSVHSFKEISKTKQLIKKKVKFTVKKIKSM